MHLMRDILIDDTAVLARIAGCHNLPRRGAIKIIRHYNNINRTEGLYISCVWFLVLRNKQLTRTLPGSALDVSAALASLDDYHHMPDKLNKSELSPTSRSFVVDRYTIHPEHA